MRCECDVLRLRRRGRLGSVNAAAAAAALLPVVSVCVAPSPPRRRATPPLMPRGRQAPRPGGRPARPAPGWIGWHMGWRGVNRSTDATTARDTRLTPDRRQAARPRHPRRQPTPRQPQPSPPPPAHPSPTFSAPALARQRDRGPRRRGRRGATWPRSPPACPHSTPPRRSLVPRPGPAWLGCAAPRWSVDARCQIRSLPSLTSACNCWLAVYTELQRSAPRRTAHGTHGS